MDGMDGMDGMDAQSGCPALRRLLSSRVVTRPLALILPVADICSHGH